MRFLLTLLFILSPLSLSAAYLSEVDTSPSDRIGIYIGTFDPPHLGHQAIVANSLKKLNLDYILVIPNSLNFHKPFATPYAVRLKMLSALYRSDKQVLLPNPGAELNPKQIIDILRQRAPKAKFVGIVGSDVSASIIEWLGYKYLGNKIDETVVVARGDQNMAKSETTDGQLTIKAANGFSSSKIRFDPELARSAVDSRVRKIMFPKGAPSLYSAKVRKHNCIAYLKKHFLPF